MQYACRFYATNCLFNESAQRSIISCTSFCNCTDSYCACSPSGICSQEASGPSCKCKLLRYKEVSFLTQNGCAKWSLHSKWAIVDLRFAFRLYMRVCKHLTPFLTLYPHFTCALQLQPYHLPLNPLLHQPNRHVRLKCNVMHMVMSI